MTPFQRRLRAVRIPPTSSVRAEARQGDRTPLFSFAGERPTQQESATRDWVDTALHVAVIVTLGLVCLAVISFAF